MSDRQLHASWFQFELGEKPSDIDHDSLSYFVGRVKINSATLFSLANDAGSIMDLEEATRNAAAQLYDLATEAEFLINQWQEDKKPTVRQVAGGES